MTVMGRLERDFDAVEAALRARDNVRPSAAALKGPFGRALRRFFDSVRGAEADLARLRLELERGGTATKFAISPAMKNVFIPHRMKILKDFLLSGKAPVHSN